MSGPMLIKNGLRSNELSGGLMSQSFKLFLEIINANLLAKEETGHPACHKGIHVGGE